MEQFLSRIIPQLDNYKELSLQRAMQEEIEKEAAQREKEELRKKKKYYQERFDTIFLKNAKSVVAHCKPFFADRGLEIRLESHQYKGFYIIRQSDPNRAYMVISIGPAKSTYSELHEFGSCLVFTSDVETNTVKLHLKKFPNTEIDIHANELDEPYFLFNMDNYNLDNILLQLERYVELRLAELQDKLLQLDSLDRTANSA